MSIYISTTSSSVIHSPINTHTVGKPVHRHLTDMTAFMQSEKKNQILIKNCSPLKKDVGSNFQFHTVFTQVPVVISITKN